MTRNTVRFNMEIMLTGGVEIWIGIYWKNGAKRNASVLTNINYWISILLISWITDGTI